MKKHILQEEVDTFGLPLKEQVGQEVEVEFEFKDRPAVIRFEIEEPGHPEGSSFNRDPMTYEPGSAPKLKTLGAYYNDTDEDLDFSLISPEKLDQLEDMAIDQYWGEYS